MIEKLKIKVLYDDFIKNVFLTDEQIKLLDMLINGDSIVKISIEIGMSERTVGYEIRKLKDLYKGYYDLQMTKSILLIE